MTFQGFDVYIRSGLTDATHYSKGDNISLLEISNSDQDYYQTGVLSLFDVNTEHSIGDSVRVFINDGTTNSLQFDGYIARRNVNPVGKKQYTYQLVGRTYDLWRYTTGEGLTNTGYTSTIASSLVANYCQGVVYGNENVDEGTQLVYDIDLGDMVIGDALIKLTDIDGYKFYVETDGRLIYYKPLDTDTSVFSISEEDILDMTPIEVSDSDIVNDVLIIGGTGYSEETSVPYPGDMACSSQYIESGMFFATRFKATDDRLSTLRFYLGRTEDPNQPSLPLNLEIWENAALTIYDDDFTSKPSNYYTISSNTYIDNNINKLSLHCDNTTYGLGWAIDGGGHSATKYLANIIKPPISGILYYFWVVTANTGTPGTIWFEIRPTGTTGLPMGPGTAYTSSSAWCPGTSSWQAVGTYFDKSIPLNSGVAVVFYREDGSSIYDGKRSASPTGYVRWASSTDDSTWSAADYYLAGEYIVQATGATRITGSVTTKIYEFPDLKYIRVRTQDNDRGDELFYEVSNDEGQTFYQLTSSNSWYTFAAAKSSARVRIHFSANSGEGPTFPRIGRAMIDVGDSTGGVDQYLFTDDFTTSTYISTQSKSGMTIAGPISGLGYLAVTGSYKIADSYGEVEWIRADSVELETYPTGSYKGNYPGMNHWVWDGTYGWESTDNLVSENSPADKEWGTGLHTGAHEYQFGIGWFIFTFNNPVTIDAIMTSSIAAGAMAESPDFYMYGIEVSGTSWGDWKVCRTDNYSNYIYQYGQGSPQCMKSNLSDSNYGHGYVYSGVKKIKILSNYNWHATVHPYIRLYPVRFRQRFYKTSNSEIRSVDIPVVSETDFSKIKLTPTNEGLSDYITYSGSLDSGTSWTKLIKGEGTTVTQGRDCMIWYCFRPSGSWPASYSSSIMKPAFGSVDSVTVVAELVQGGGMPKSGSKLEWSDDINFYATDVPYQPSFSSWKSYTSPKLELISGASYWLVLSHVSGEGNPNVAQGKYWKFFNDWGSSYEDGLIAYSWNQKGIGVVWSSSILCGDLVPGGSMIFELGYGEAGNVRATATNEGSIAAYGRHFKKIEDSTVTTKEEAQSRADTEVESGEPPHKGTFTIDGILDIQTNYKFSANISNLGFNEKLDIVSYTQRIDNTGFKTIINYGQQPYDIAGDVAKLKNAVYG